ncbi:hypothetical protein GJ654_08550 [Rhodoblastus acidophilus]|uniref:Uncharacterized protein n=1 Tax=Rhodoblastus acidophilus TaxID=1074 RepID=A0A6N8DPC1_RHOAC|nr:hypothetical protein [Rhodoblastus acidophilus]MCW2273807.1 outer membrane biosynthesis protein TonB [Rhodoblastus acidophilus]MTV31043.1 hypothetical protein [Rhodoblastus acidophilus]
MNRTLALSLLALALATGAAQAGCPRGQIYRVSKHACIDHDEAVKLGIVHGPAHNADKAKPEAEAAQEPAPQDSASPASPPAAAPEPPAVAEQPAAVPEPEATPSAAQVKTVRTVKITAPKPAAPAPGDPAAVKTEASAASPFGALDPGGVPMSQPR